MLRLGKGNVSSPHNHNHAIPMSTHLATSRYAVTLRSIGISKVVREAIHFDSRNMKHNSKVLGGVGNYL